MKISCIIAALIVAVASYFGIERQTRIKKLGTENQDLVIQAKDLGIPAGINESFLSERTIQKTREREREDLVDQFISELKPPMDEMAENGSAEAPDMEARGQRLVSTLLGFSTSELEMMIAKVSAGTALDPQEKEELTMFSLMMLSDDSPMKALAIISKAKESGLIEPDRSRLFLENAISGLARENPLAAADWIRENSDVVGKTGDDLMVKFVIPGAGLQDFGLALSLVDDLKSDKGRAFGSLGKIVTADRGDGFLAAIRKNRATSAEKLGAFRSLADGQFVHDFKGASEWLAASKLNHDEQNAFISNMRYPSLKENPGEWMTWVNTREAGTETAMEIRKRVNRQMISAWTKADFVAAGEWVGALPGGDTRDGLVAAYAETLVQHEPEGAAEWAATLPDGNEKTDILSSIHDSYRSNSPEKASAFAKKFGLKTAEAIILNEEE